MNIEGTYTLQAPAEQVWRTLMDPQILKKSIPGIERLEQLDAQTYIMTLQIGNAPLRGTYQGRITINEQEYPYRYHITIEGESDQQKFSGNGDIHLAEHEETTVIAYQGDLEIDRQNTSLSPTLIKGLLKLLMQQFFSSLSERLGRRTNAKPIETATVIDNANGSLILIPAPPLIEESETSMLRRVVRLLGLGAGDQDEEAHWEQRIQRWGMIAGLLLLVWIGMRLIPRRDMR
jgi:carbon monoxide dehydrogenase subunit G